jgi:hypothetical protein
MTQRCRFASFRISPAWILAPCVCFVFGCGGGGGNSQSAPPPPPSPNFTLGASPTSVSISVGSSNTTSVSATGTNGFTSTIAVQVSGLPAGVTASPASFNLSPGNSQTVTLSAAANAAVATNARATFAGTSGSLSSSAFVSVTVVIPPPPATLTTRTKYVRTDSVTEYPQWLNTHWTVYHAPTSRVFVTDPEGNQIIVLNTVTEKQIATIAVPSAFGIDETPDQSTLYVATLIGDVYTVDPVAMKITKRYLGSQIGPQGFASMQALPLSDGRVALLAASGGIQNVDGSSLFGVWNPVDNSLVNYATPNRPPFARPFTPVCGPYMGNFGGFALNPSRTQIFVGSIDSDGTLCQVDPTTGQSNYVSGEGTSTVIFSPDGKYFIFRVPVNLGNGMGELALYDANTLSEVEQLTVTGDTSSAASLIFSSDSKTLFVSDAEFVYAYAVPSGNFIGWTPNLFVNLTSGCSICGPTTDPDFGVEDGTGLLIGPQEEGVGFVDTTQMRTGAIGSGFTNAYLNPATGAVSGNTLTQWQTQTGLTSQSPVFFNSVQVASVSVSNGNVTVTTPPGNAGPADVYALAPDGGVEIIPDGFSYGPTVLEVTPNLSTADGGGLGVIYGYGFGPLQSSNPQQLVPAGLSVTVGGVNASIVGFNPTAYNVEIEPFLLQAIYYTIPPGSVGSANVTVTTPSGSITSHGGLTYVPAAQQVPLAGAALAEGVYDPGRDVYYFTDQNQVRVFSLTSKQFLTSISIPSVNGAQQRLWGIALSADGTKLAIADIQNDFIYLVNPSSPSSVQRFPFAPPNLPQGVLANPAGIAVSNSGVVYVAAYMEGGTGLHSFYSLNTNNGNLTDYGIDGPQFSIDGAPQDVYLKVAISSDNTRVFFNNDGQPFSIDTATGIVLNATSDPGCCYGDYDLTLSANQTSFAASTYLYDSDLNAQSFLTLNDREIQDLAGPYSYVYGAKLSPDGSLYFQPSSNGIDIFDGRLGTYRARLALPFGLSTLDDSLVSDGKDNILLAINAAGDGIAVIDLRSLPEPSPLNYPGESGAAIRRASPATRSGFAPLRGIPHHAKPALASKMPPAHVQQR